MGTVDVPGTGFVLAANFQYFSGKPWAAQALVSVPQSPQQRIQLTGREISKGFLLMERRQARTNGIIRRGVTPRANSALKQPISV